MKRKILGIIIMIVGFTMIAAGTAMFVEAAGTEPAAKQNEISEEKVMGGKYVSDSGAVITVSGDEITVNGKTDSFSLSVWRNLPVTDEETGKITYLNYYYIRTDNSQYSYDPSGGIITISEVEYRL